MKKRGKLAFVIYTISCLLAAGLLLLAYIEVQNIPEPDVDNFGALGVGLLLILAMIIGVPSGASFVLKFLHIISNKKIFAILCIILDFAMILYLGGAHLIVIYGFEYWVKELSTMGLSLLCLLIPASALVSNAISLGE